MCTYNITELKSILLQLDNQRSQLVSQLEIYDKVSNIYYLPASHVPKVIYNNDIKDPMIFCDQYRDTLNYTKRWHLVTLTFDPSISKRLVEFEQQEALIFILKKHSKQTYYACIEKHLTGILHSHMLICYDPIDLRKMLDLYKSRLTPKRQMMPAINVKSVESTTIGINRAYEYIFKHKKDHPEYKDLIINI